MRNKIYYSSRC